MIEPQAEKRGISMVFTPCESPYCVQVDRTRVKQVLINLLSNAIKYNREGGTVIVTCVARTAGRIRIAVEDTGEGLPPEKNRTTVSAVQSSRARKHHQEGTGIGLVMTKRLIELMNGEIGLESTVGKGQHLLDRAEHVS